MNIDVFILFFNATFVTVLSCVIVLGILRKQYLPVIKKEEKKQRDNFRIGGQKTDVKGESKS